MQSFWIDDVTQWINQSICQMKTSRNELEHFDYAVSFTEKTSHNELNLQYRMFLSYLCFDDVAQWIIRWQSINVIIDQQMIGQIQHWKKKWKFVLLNIACENENKTFCQMSSF